MTDINELLARIEVHIRQTDAKRSTVSRKLFGSGTRLDQIIDKGGSNVTYRVINEVAAKLSQLEQGDRAGA